MKIKEYNGKINWKCKGEKCENSCCGKFDERNNIFSSNFCSVNNIGHDEILLMDRDVENILKYNNKRYIKKIKGNYYIRLNGDSSCPFLIKGKCSIYNIRPLLCRSYPFYIDASSGLVIDKCCPGVGYGWTDMVVIKKYIEALTDLYLNQILIIKKQYCKK